MSDLPACKWNETQVIQIKFNNNDSIVKTAITVPARVLTEDDIKISEFESWSYDSHCQFFIEILDSEVNMYENGSQTNISGSAITIKSEYANTYKITKTGYPSENKWDVTGENVNGKTTNIANGAILITVHTNVGDIDFALKDNAGNWVAPKNQQH